MLSSESVNIDFNFARGAGKATILEKKSWDSLSDLVQRGSPLSPNAMLIRVMLPEAAPGRPTLIDGGGEGYDQWGVRRLL